MPDVWHDEAALLVNVIRLDFRQMLGPQLVHQAAPPLFLFIERVMYLQFGDGIVALRMFPFLASLASVVLVALLAKQVLTPQAALWAVALFAVSDRMLWHAVEAKPYAIDVFVAAAVAYGYVVTRHYRLWQQCLFALPVLPVIVWLSYPACFVIGGWFVAQLPALRRSRLWRDWLAFFAVAGLVAISFLWLAEGPVKAQRDGELDAYWATAFPDWQRPWTVPVWIISSTFNIFCYCIPPQGWALAGAVFAGGALLWRLGEKRLLALLFAPLGLTLIASLLGKYPYCGTRLLAFMTPSFCLLAAAGVQPVAAWIRDAIREPSSFFGLPWRFPS